MRKVQIILRRLFQKNQTEEQLDDELRAYLEHDIQQRIAEGSTPDEAKRAALLEFGGIEQVKEHVRQNRPEAWLDGALADGRYALRALGRRPSFTTIAVLTLALGIGAATSMYAVVDNVLLRPLKHRDSDRLVTIWGIVGALKTDTVIGGIWNQFTLSWEDYQEWLHQQSAFEETALFATGSARFAGDDETRTVNTARASSNFFAMLGTPFFRGRSFGEREEEAVVVTYEFWNQALGADPNPIGRTITLDQSAKAIVVGVLPPRFHFAGHGANTGPNPEIWQPLRITDPAHPDYEVIGRLRPRIPLADAERETDLIFRNLRFAFLNELPSLDKRHGAHLELRRDVETSAVRTPLLILFLSSGLLLLIACGNVANVLLAEVGVREHEIAMRSALGATRVRIIRQLILESLLLGMIGGILGCGIAWLGVRALVGLAPAGLPRFDEIAFDLRILIVVSGVSAATGVAFGLAPAVGLARADLVETLKNRAGHRGSARSRSQGAVVIAEISLCFMLLVGAGLLAQSLMRLSSVDPGFDPNNLLAIQVELPRRDYEDSQIRLLYRQMFSELGSLPGVMAVTGTDGVPFQDFRRVAPMTINGSPAVIETRSVWPNYFDVLGGRVIEGRTFTENETNGTAIINRSMARQFWPNESAINKRVEFKNGFVPIIGISDDVRQLGLAISPPPMYYVPMTAETRFTVLIRTAQDPLSVAPAVRARIRSIDKNIAVNWVEPMRNLVLASFAEERYRTLLITIFALSAVCLALVGLYGVISRYVAFRNRELGIRLAIGAEPRRVLTLILGKGLVLTTCGVLLGWAGALGLTRVLSGYLFGISPRHTATYAGVAVLLTAVSLVAAFGPARRASRIDPIQSLRTE